MDKKDEPPNVKVEQENVFGSPHNRFEGGITWVDLAYDGYLREVLAQVEEDIENRGPRYPLDDALQWLNSRLSQKISLRGVLTIAADQHVALAAWSESTKCWLYLCEGDLHRFETDADYQANTLLQHKTAYSFYNRLSPELVGSGSEFITVNDLVIFERDLLLAQDYLLRRESNDAARCRDRYTLSIAAEVLSARTGERRETILRRFVNAAAAGELAMYEPEKCARYDYSSGKRVRDFYEEAYWDDLNAWLERNEPRISFMFPAPSVDNQKSATENIPTPNVRACDQPKRNYKQRDQENALLSAIKELGYDATSLPKNSKGKKGVKAAVRERLVRTSLFKGRTVFDKAWERLRKDGQINEAP